MYNFTFLWIKLLNFLFNIVIGPEPSHNLYALLISPVHIRGDFRLLISISAFKFILRVVVSIIIWILGLWLLTLFKIKVAQAHVYSIAFQKILWLRGIRLGLPTFPLNSPSLMDFKVLLRMWFSNYMLLMISLIRQIMLVMKRCCCIALIVNLDCYLIR